MKKIISTLILCIYLTGCYHKTIKNEGNHQYVFFGEKWSQIEKTDGKSYESYPTKLNVVLKGSDKYVYILEKSAKPLDQHIENGNLKFSCKNSIQMAQWKWNKNNLMIQCGKKAKWRKAKYKNLDYKNYWK